VEEVVRHSRPTEDRCRFDIGPPAESDCVTADFGSLNLVAEDVRPDDEDDAQRLCTSLGQQAGARRRGGGACGGMWLCSKCPGNPIIPKKRDSCRQCGTLKLHAMRPWAVGDCVVVLQDFYVYVDLPPVKQGRQGVVLEVEGCSRIQVQFREPEEVWWIYKRSFSRLARDVPARVTALPLQRVFRASAQRSLGSWGDIDDSP